MALPDQIRAGIARARATLDPLMVDIQHIPTTGRDQHGPIHGDPVPLRAIVEDVGEAILGDDGNEHMSTSKLTILQPWTVRTSDMFIVNGEELNVAKRGGLLDPDGQPYFIEVWLGRGRFVQG